MIKSPVLFFGIILQSFLFISSGNSRKFINIDFISPEDTALTSPFSTTPLLIKPLEGILIFDGIINDPCWENCPSIRMVMHIPTFGLQPSEKSDLFICHDDDYVYLAGRFFDSEADKINVSSRIRDVINPNEDSFTVIFDTFHDRENGIVFQVNSAGVRQDMTIAKDGTEQFPWDNTWNNFWDVKTTRDDEGWYMEMRIPVSSLRFKVKNGKVQMGVIFFRYIPRKFEIDVSPAIPRDWGFWSFVKPSQARVAELESVQSKKPFYIAPYITGGIYQEALLNSTEDGFNMQNDPKLTGGLDIKYGVTSNITADLTLNTDFAQVEADNAQINLTRFSLFFPEKRLFFQERASNFNFSFDEMNTVFYSRQIGLHDGVQVPILGGIRLVGRAGPWDIGFLDMQTSTVKLKGGNDDEVPSENFGVIRIRRQVINPNSYIGGIFTSRLGRDGKYNEVAGLDGIIKIFGNDYLDLKYAQSFDDKYQNKAFSPDASRIWLDWQRRSEKGLGYDFFYSRAGKRFEPDMGFELRKNYYMAGTMLKYGLIAGEKSKISNSSFSITGQFWKDNSSNITQSALISAGYNMALKSSPGFNVNLNHAYEFLADTFYLSNDDVIAYVLPEKYNYNYATISFNSSYTKKISIFFTSMIGQYYDGYQVTSGFNSSLRMGAFMNLQASYEFYRIRFNSRDQTFNGHIASIKPVLMLTNKLSISSFIQYSNIAHGILTNIRLRYNPKEGNDLYIVVNEGRNIELNRETPHLNPVDNRGILIKYTYTFIL